MNPWILASILAKLDTVPLNLVQWEWSKQIHDPIKYIIWTTKGGYFVEESAIAKSIKSFCEIQLNKMYVMVSCAHYWNVVEDKN